MREIAAFLLALIIIILGTTAMALFYKKIDIGCHRWVFIFVASFLISSPALQFWYRSIKKLLDND